MTLRSYIAIALFLAGLAALIGLGAWQYQRLQWKETLITDLRTQYSLRDAGKGERLTRFGLDQMAMGNDRPIIAGNAHGRLIKDKIVYLGPRVKDGKAGYDVIVPMRIADGTLLINVGWVDEENKNRIRLPRGITTIGGLARKPDYSSFASGNSPAQDIWMRADIDEIAAARELDNVARLMFYATGMEKPSPFIVMHDSQWLPRNEHRQYMIFWWTMAALWCAICALAWWKFRKQ